MFDIHKAVTENNYDALLQGLERHRNEVSSDTISFAFLSAIRKADRRIATLLLDRCGDKISNKHKERALENAAEHDHLDMVTLLLDKCSEDIDDECTDFAFESAAQRKHLNIATLLLDRCSDKISNESKELTFLNAVDTGHLDMVTLLLDRCSDEISNQNKGWALKTAAENGYLDRATLLLDRCSNEIRTIDKDQALLTAAENGHFNTVTLLLNKCSGEISDDFKGTALVYAAQNGHLDTINALLTDPSVEAIATFNHNLALSEAQTHAGGGDENAARYQPIVDRLMQIPAVAALVNQAPDLAHITQFTENSMMPLNKVESALVNNLKKHYEHFYIDESWDAIRAEILNYLEAEYQKAPARDGYHYLEMLAQDEAIPVDFPVADTIGLHPQGEQCTAYWNDTNGDLQQKSLPLSAVTAIYQAQNKTEKLNQLTQDSDLLKAILARYNIKALPTQDKVLPLEYSPNQTASGSTAYYRHPIHSAWRYLSDHNPWMAQDAQFVHTFEDGSKAAILSDQDKELLSYFWLALNDETVTLEPGFTVQGNLQLFAATLKELTRGHNTDERDYYTNVSQANRKTTQDNLHADESTCSYGVTTRLLQSAYGHPYINCPEAQPLSADIIRERMCAQLIKPKDKASQPDTLFDKLNKLELNILKYIHQEIEIALEIQEDNTVVLSPQDIQKRDHALTIPNEQIEDFMTRTKDWFGEQRIEEKQQPELSLPQFRNTSHPTYPELINHCLQNPLAAFTTEIYQHLQERIQALNTASANKKSTHTPAFQAVRHDHNSPKDNENERSFKKTKPR